MCYISTGCDPGSEQSSPWSLPCARGGGRCWGVSECTQAGVLLLGRRPGRGELCWF